MIRIDIATGAVLDAPGAGSVHPASAPAAASAPRPSLATTVHPARGRTTLPPDLARVDCGAFVAAQSASADTST